MQYTPETVPDEAVEALRPAFEKFGLEGEQYTPEFWIEQCRQGNAQLWRSDDGLYWGVTTMFDSTKGRVFHKVASAGVFNDSARALYAAGDEWAKARGCTLTRTEGRPGWAKLLSDWKVVAVTLEKEL
jgi:hypothetical protein